jgi:heat shock protein HslJ
VKKSMMLLLTLSLVLAACGSQPASLTGTWMLTAYGPENSLTPALTEDEAMLTFGEDGTVTGSGGCNSLGGEYEVDGDQITFAELVSTLMACDDSRMAQEGVVTQVLSGTAQYKIEDNILTLKNNDMVLVFSAVPGN